MWSRRADFRRRHLHSRRMTDIDEQGRPEPPLAADEVDTLIGFLEFQRAAEQPVDSPQSDRHRAKGRTNMASRSPTSARLTGDTVGL